MLVRTRFQTHLRPASTAPQPPAEKKDPSELTLPPDNRFHWDPEQAKWAKRALNVIIPVGFRVKIEGRENLPEDGNFIMGGTHQNGFDGLLATKLLGDKPYASMIDIEQFRGVVGHFFANTGGIPVDRFKEYDGDFPDPVEHSVEVLNQGRNFLIYPEGGVYTDPVVYPLKTGMARIGLASNVKYAVPVAQHYAKDTESHPLEGLVGVGLSAAATAAGIWAASQGGWAGATAGALTGLVSGLVVGAGAGFATGPSDNLSARAGKAAKWGAIAAVATAVAGGAVGSVAPGAAPWVVGSTSALTGLAGLGATYHWTHRPVATLKVGQPVDLDPYRQRAQNSSEPDAQWKESLRLTADFHEILKATKTQVTGVESPFKMDLEGNAWGKQPDGSWARVERNEEHRWVPIPSES